MRLPFPSGPCLSGGPLLFCLSLGLGLLFAGCRAAAPSPSPSAAGAETGPPYLTIGPDQRVGLVAWVQAGGATAVVELDPPLIQPPAGRLIARGADFAPRAVVELSGEPRGRFHPATILAGTVSVGDTVVAPGPALRAWGEARLAAEGGQAFTPAP